MKKKRKEIQGFCKNFTRDPADPKTAIINCRVKVDDLLKENLHACGDTMMLELYLVEAREKALIATAAARDANLSFVGEAVLRWKHCFEEANVNEWDKLGPVYLGDAQGRMKATTEVLSAQLFIWVRFLDISHPNSAFNADGTKKPPKPRYGEFQREEDKHDRRT